MSEPVLQAGRRRLLVAAAAWWAGALAPARAASLVQSFGKPLSSPSRIFAAGPPAAVLIACLAPDRLLGWPMPLSDAARAWVPPVLRDKPMLGRLSGRGSTVSLEALLALQPQLIVDAGSVDGTYASTARRVAEQTGLPYVLIDGRLADSAAQLHETGRLIGATERGQALAAYADEALAAAATARPDPPPAIYLARGPDGLETATSGSINAEIIQVAGGRNVAATGRAGVARVSMEQVLVWAPEWIVTQDRQFHREARVNPDWRVVSAVQKGQVLLAPDLPFGWIDGPPSVNRLLGLKWLAAKLRRSRVDAVEEARRFCTLFYGTTPAPDIVQGWLDGAN